MLARMMKQILFLGALAAPLVLGCNKASTDPCASAFTASASAAITFCETYTKSTVTATTSLPAFATNCSNSKKISSACTCLLGTAASVSRFLFGWMAHLLSIMVLEGYRRYYYLHCVGLCPDYIRCCILHRHCLRKHLCSSQFNNWPYWPKVWI